MNITIPDFCLVVLVGPTCAGKSTFAEELFAPTEVLSSDVFRALLTDDLRARYANREVFQLLHQVVSARLALRRRTVVDATNVLPPHRQSLVTLARANDAAVIAVVLDTPYDQCEERRATRGWPSREVLQHQYRQFSRWRRHLKRERFHRIEVVAPGDVWMPSPGSPLQCDMRQLPGPFDIIGDVHGCYDELVALLQQLSYSDLDTGMPRYSGAGRRRTAIFLGDLIDRGPQSLRVLDLVGRMIEAGAALGVTGNHEARLARYLNGHDVRITHGLDCTIRAIEGAHPRVARVLDQLGVHYMLDGGRLAVAHAGLPAAYQNRESGRVRRFALYGSRGRDVDTEEVPPPPGAWAADYRGDAFVVYGHIAHAQPRWTDRTVGIDTGCVYGGALTALRWPEREIVSVPAASVYYTPEPGQFMAAAPSGVGCNSTAPAALPVESVLNLQRCETRFSVPVMLPRANVGAAFETMCRYTVDPRWLIYLPPTMAPVAAAPDGELLERPEEAFEYYRARGVPEVVCELKHMGSHAVVVVCESAAVATARFGVEDSRGAIYTRTGRPFFPPTLEAQVLARIAAALSAAGFWARYRTQWFCLDVEIMPWAYKAAGLLATQYMPAAIAGEAALRVGAEALRGCIAESDERDALVKHYERRLAALHQYTRACATFGPGYSTPDDLHVAPFHILATEGHVWDDVEHMNHTLALSELPCRELLFQVTPCVHVVLNDAASCASGTAYWRELTEEVGAEGVVVKPLDWHTRSPTTGRQVQPALKVRGREYLRIIYGPEYTEHLDRLRIRRLQTRHRRALQEYHLGLEGLHRFVEGQPLVRVHECAFAVLALEEEPDDPRF